MENYKTERSPWMKKKKRSNGPKKESKDQFLLIKRKKTLSASSACLPKRSVVVLIDTFAGLLDFPRVVLLSLTTLSMVVSFSLTKGFLLCNAPKKERYSETDNR